MSKWDDMRMPGWMTTELQTYGGHEVDHFIIDEPMEGGVTNRCAGDLHVDEKH